MKSVKHQDKNCDNDTAATIDSLSETQQEIIVTDLFRYFQENHDEDLAAALRTLLIKMLQGPPPLDLEALQRAFVLVFTTGNAVDIHTKKQLKRISLREIFSLDTVCKANFLRELRLLQQQQQQQVAIRQCIPDYVNCRGCFGWLVTAFTGATATSSNDSVPTNLHTANSAIANSSISSNSPILCEEKQEEDDGTFNT